MTHAESQRWPEFTEEPVGSEHRPYTQLLDDQQDGAAAQGGGTWGDPNVEPAPVSAYWENPGASRPAPRAPSPPGRGNGGSTPSHRSSSGAPQGNGASGAASARPSRPAAPSRPSRPAAPSRPSRPAAPSRPSRPAAPSRPAGGWLDYELERERAARAEAERSAERLAAAVAKEHKLRVHAEREAEQAVRELELVRAQRYFTRESPPHHGRGGTWWRRLLNWLQA